MANKTNVYLVEYAKQQLGLPYWYGTYGNTATEALYLAKKKQYPNQYKATDYPKQYGLRVTDCVGLIKGALWSETPTSKPVYNKEQDTSANGMIKRCSVRGPIETIPDIPGVLVHKDGHIGVYIGDGYVIEAKGHASGVVQTRLKERPWTDWGKLDYITYLEDIKLVDIQMPVLKKGMKGLQEIKTLQTLLNAKGFKGADGKELTVDGSFGSNTDFALRAFQQAVGLEVDGSCGKKTWTEILRN